MFKSQCLDGAFGLVVEDLEINSASDGVLAELVKLLYLNRFLVIRTGGISREEYVRFAKRLGEPITLSRDPAYPEIAEITNQGVSTVRTKKGAAHWHTDQSFRETVSSITMLYSLKAPQEGGETQFCDLAAAYDELPEETRQKLQGLVVEHRHGVSVSAPKEDHVPIPPKGWDSNSTAYHPLVRKHPETGEKTLYAVTGTAQGIRGMGQDQSTRLLQRLTKHALQPKFIALYKHRVNDILLWDNPTVMHRASPIDQATDGSNTRLLLRISLKGSPPVLYSTA